jgi:hypothetical protein
MGGPGMPGPAIIGLGMGGGSGLAKGGINGIGIGPIMGDLGINGIGIGGNGDQPYF